MHKLDEMNRTSGNRDLSPEPAAPAKTTLSIILPALNETGALRETVQRIEETNHGGVLEYLIVLCREMTSDSRAVASVSVTHFDFWACFRNRIRGLITSQ